MTKHVYTSRKITHFKNNYIQQKNYIQKRIIITVIKTEPLQAAESLLTNKTD